MNAPDPSFMQLRPRLFGIAYRMLGSRADAEDVLQEAWLRWHATDRARIAVVEAWLVTVVTRLSIDKLREHKRDQYSGPWLPEPVVEFADDALSQLEFAHDVSLAFLQLLEKLSPEERAAFLLRETFDMDYAEIAALLEKSQAACRQLVHRAKERLAAPEARFLVNETEHRQVLSRFIAAAQSGHREALMAIFTPQATFVGDGGGKVLSTLRPLRGAERLAEFYLVRARYGHVPELRYVAARINGRPGLLRYLNGKLDAAIDISVEAGQVSAVRVVRNPDKLARIHAGTLVTN